MYNEKKLFMNLHDLRQAQANFDIAEIADKRKPLHKLRQAFVKDYNPRFLAQMDIDAYVAGKGNFNAILIALVVSIISIQSYVCILLIVFLNTMRY